ncbi:MAG: sterol desaturase family protein [Acidobacteria bacterium]|nr:sterol desaturase family protein [Acidobacteriota bacterium]
MPRLDIAKARVTAGMLFGLAVLSTAALLYAGRGTGLKTQLVPVLRAGESAFAASFLQDIVLNPLFYLVVAAVLGLERLIPAVSGQPVFSRGFFQDLVWAPFTLTMHSYLLPLHIALLSFVYNRYLGFLTLHSLESWPWLPRVILGLFASDFLFWASHYVRHKVKVLWYFHAIHHSQRELNFFTDYHVHPLDDVFLYTLGFIPLFMVQSSFITIVAVTWVRAWQTRFYHSNIRTNLGWLRYLLVTPQSHRVHHSIELRHRDCNFGLTFCLWDHLFGTQYRGYDEYPATGIDDESYPCQHEGDGRLAWLTQVFNQLLYPFEALQRAMKPTASATHRSSRSMRRCPSPTAGRSSAPGQRRASSAPSSYGTSRSSGS